jgi:DNA-binding PadR family transcriptional regulator
MSEQSSHLRLIYENSAGKGIVDSKEIQDPGKVITPDPVSVYPWQKSTVSFGLNRTNGTAELMVFKDTELVRKEELRRVTDDNFFIKRLEFDDPGNYVIEVSDNHGRIASGLLHIYDLNIELVEDAGVTYVFNVTVDSEPMESGEVTVSLNNGTSSKDLYINEGSLKINAKLDEGMNTFNMKMLGTTIPVQVEHHGGSVFQFYLTYGIPGLILVGAVFLIARMSRRPIYRIRFSDVGSQIRKEIMLSPDDALSALKSIREEMSLQKSPITADEFAIAIKRYVTNGAEVTSGNVEEILNRLCNKGILESHQGYYQPKGEGEIKRNALMRIIREKLIENGITFKAMKNKFSTKDCEIGFFGGNFKKKALIIVDDENELRSIMDSLDEKEKSRLKIRQSNDMLVFVPISKLVDYL